MSSKTIAEKPTPHVSHRVPATVFRTRWGWTGVAVSDKGVSAIVLSKPSRSAAEQALATFAGVRLLGRGQGQGKTRHSSRATGHLLRDAQRQVVAFLTGKRKTIDVPIDLSGGSSFQRRVWQTALRIPYGRARSYGWIASKLGGRRYARAVGHALGTNPVPLIVPCHRVLAYDASLGGFSCGLPVKRKLLKLEGTLALLQQGQRRHS